MQNRRNFNQSQNNEINNQQNMLILFAKPQTELRPRIEAAKYLPTNEQTLAVWKCIQHLPIVKIGRLVRYKKSDFNRLCPFSGFNFNLISCKFCPQVVTKVLAQISPSG